MGTFVMVEQNPCTFQFKLMTIFSSHSQYEALVMILCYVVYCVALHFNSALEKWAYSLKLPIKLPTKEEQSALVTFKNVPDQNYSQNASETNGNATEQQQQQHATSPDAQQPANYQGTGYNHGTE